MKNYTTIFFFSLLLGLNIHCKKENEKPATNTNKPLLQEGMNINIDALKSMIPAIYKNEKKIVFVNKSGDKIIFQSYYSESPKVADKYNNVNFTFDTFQANLQSVSPKGITIGLYGSANFNTADVYLQSLLIQLMPLNPDYAINSITLSNKNEFIEKEKFSGFNTLATFNGKVFKDVYTSHLFENQKAYAQISFNTEFGIVSFLDEKNDLYVFDRFE